MTTKTKLIGAGAAVAAMLAAMGASSFAEFTATGTSPTQTFKAGTVKIQVGQNCVQYVESETSHGTIAELNRVPDEEVAIEVAGRQVGGKAVGDMIDAASSIRHREHVNQRARSVGDVDSCGASPDRLKPVETLIACVVDEKNDALGCRALMRDTAGCKDERLVEELLGEIPVMGRRPASDVAEPE